VQGNTSPESFFYRSLGRYVKTCVFRGWSSNAIDPWDVDTASVGYMPFPKVSQNQLPIYLEALSLFENLQTLRFVDTDVDDEILDTTTRLKKLTHLVFDHCNFHLAFGNGKECQKPPTLSLVRLNFHSRPIPSEILYGTRIDRWEEINTNDRQFLFFLAIDNCTMFSSLKILRLGFVGRGYDTIDLKTILKCMPELVELYLLDMAWASGDHTPGTLVSLKNLTILHCLAQLVPMFMPPMVGLQHVNLYPPKIFPTRAARIDPAVLRPNPILPRNLAAHLTVLGLSHKLLPSTDRPGDNSDFSANFPRLQVLLIHDHCQKSQPVSFSDLENRSDPNVSMSMSTLY